MSAVASYHHSYRDQSRGHTLPAKAKPAGKRRGMLRRLLDAMVLSRQRRAEREIAAHFGLSDGHMTDEIERRMSEHFMGRGGFRA